LRSLQVKFSALVVALLVVACVSLAVVATRHEQAALEAEVEERGRSLARLLAVAAGDAIAAAGSPDREALDRFVEAATGGPGVRALRIVAVEGESLAAAGLRGPDGPVRVMTVAVPWQGAPDASLPSRSH
jgi:uncharacterized membrane protein affecting hemolysin expression